MDDEVLPLELPSKLWNTFDDKVLALTNFELLMPASLYKIDEHEFDEHEVAKQLTSRCMSCLTAFSMHYTYDKSTTSQYLSWDFGFGVADTPVINWLSKTHMQHITYADGHFVVKLRLSKVLRDTLYLPPGYVLRVPNGFGTWRIRCRQKQLDALPLYVSPLQTHRTLCIDHKTAGSSSREYYTTNIAVCPQDVFIAIICAAKIKSITFTDAYGGTIEDREVESHDLIKMRSKKGKGIGYLIPLGDMPMEVVHRAFKYHILEDEDISYGKYQGGIGLAIYYDSPKECSSSDRYILVATLQITTFSPDHPHIKYQQYVNAMARNDFLDQI